ncbi:hypothetical protein E4U43_006829 [Claviceps pusilla]|uniref:Uncharacterized protein n=1 Tax=Claviceps pusilla TaxID=123648 RepID=A0A9P7NDM9_9HYPO|nr:hypothetical protein E4U43_006829 [Claviceps pusilla]
MQLPSILPVALAVFGVANAQVVNHVDAQAGTEAVFYNQPFCRGTSQISAWGSSDLAQTFYFRSILLRPYNP